MEVSLLRESNFLSTPIFRSNSSRLLMISRLDDLVLADQESETCNHFTIRGYVSEVRNRNAKFCWPFHMLDHTTRYEDISSLPPLPVKNFRRWGCQSCMHSTISSKDATEKGANTTNEIDSVINDGILLRQDTTTKPSHRETTKSLDIRISNNEPYTSPTPDFNKGAIRVSRVGYTSSEDLNNKPRPVASKEETCQTREKRDGYVLGKTKTSTVSLLSEDTPKVLSSKRDSDLLVYPIAVSDKGQKLSKIGKSKESSGDDVKGLDECGIFLPRKFRKVRTLDDIMKSEKVQKDEKKSISTEKVSVETPDVSEQRDECPNDTATAIKRKKRKEAVPVDDEETCLMQWLKKVPRKASLHTWKHAAVKGVDLNLEYIERGENENEVIFEKKRNKIPAVEVVKPLFKPHKKYLHTKSAGSIVFDKSHDNVHKKVSFGCKKNKRPLVEDDTSLQIRCLKDNFIKQKRSGLQIQRQVKKKAKSMQTSERESVDDIPMDIVELLAKKQQERHLVNTKDDFASTSSIRNNSVAEFSPEVHHSCNKEKRYHFDLNQEAPDSDRDYSPQHLSSNAHTVCFNFNSGTICLEEDLNLNLNLSKDKPESSMRRETFTESSRNGHCSNNETVSALNLLRLMHQSCHSSIHDDINTGYIQAFKENMCKPLRPQPRIGVLGPQLQKEVTNTSTFSTKPVVTEKAETSISQYDGAFLPLKSTCKFEECILNRNPADFAMPDEDSEYMIGFEETKAKDMPGSQNLFRGHVSSHKGRRARKLNDLKRSKTSN